MIANRAAGYPGEPGAWWECPWCTSTWGADFSRAEVYPTWVLNSEIS